MTHETFSDEQTKILNRYVTNTTDSIFCLHNLPEVIKGALFSRYSRSTLGLRTLLLKDFILNEEESGFHEEEPHEDGTVAIRKAQKFYDRILDGYGDDSIGELGGAHLALENISMVATKEIEDRRIGGSPLEKSTRYVYFDQKINGEYQYYREPVLMTSAFRDLCLETSDHLFDTYSALIPPTTALMEQRFPAGPDVSKAAYKASIRAKVLDALRGLLPASTLTNMGLFGNGRFYEQLLHKLQGHNLAELKDIGTRSYSELGKLIPSFIRRAEPSHRHHKSYTEFFEGMASEIKAVTAQYAGTEPAPFEPGARLINYDYDAVVKVAAALLFQYSNQSLADLQVHCRDLSDEELAQILDSGCSRRENRRHKSPRALEHANFTFEIIGDYGNYRDLQRHRMLTQERQLLSCNYGYPIPAELEGTEMLLAYCEAMDKAKATYDIVSEELPEEAQYIVPMGYNIRWYFHLNLRALQWLTELRSAPQGHPNYRLIAQQMADEVCRIFPAFERFIRFVDYSKPDLGRLEQEMRKQEKVEQGS